MEGGQASLPLLFFASPSVASLQLATLRFTRISSKKGREFSDRIGGALSHARSPSLARDAEGRRAYIDRIDPPSPSELRRGRQDRHDLSSAFPEEKSRDDVYALIGAAAMGGGEHINNSTFFINLIEETPRTNPVSPCIGMPAL
jgi:hypothetical protein